MVKCYAAAIAIMFITEISYSQSSIGNKNNSEMQSDTIFSKGTIISGKNFSGIAWLNWLVPNDSIFNCPVGSVTFEPGARTNWHKHPGGQILLVTGGKGYYQERGKPVQLIKKGDVVLIGPDVEHWHGATSKGQFSHIAINTNVYDVEAVWLEPVPDEYYNTLNKQNYSKN